MFPSSQKVGSKSLVLDSLKFFPSTNSNFGILFRFTLFLFRNTVEEEKVIYDMIWSGVPKK